MADFHCQAGKCFHEGVLNVFIENWQVKFMHNKIDIKILFAVFIELILTQKFFLVLKKSVLTFYMLFIFLCEYEYGDFIFIIQDH